MTRRWIVYRFEHPVFGVCEVGRYRFKILARLRAWLFETFEGATLWSEAWVTDGR